MATSDKGLASGFINQFSFAVFGGKLYLTCCFRSFQDAGLFQHTFSKDLSKHKLLNLMLFELLSMLCPMWEPISSSMMARAALKGHENYRSSHIYISVTKAKLVSTSPLEVPRDPLNNWFEFLDLETVTIGFVVKF